MRILMLVVSSLLTAAISFAAPTVRFEPYPLKTKSHGTVQAELGRMTVPLRRVDPNGGNAELVFIRIPGKRPAPPIIFLAGGPGDSGTGASRSPEAMDAFASLSTAGDVILLDQRGVGMSSPRPGCRPDAPLAPEERFADRAVIVPRAIERGKRCVDEWAAKGVDVRAFTNAESAADIDDLRRALGAEKVSLFGFSYGTHLALATLRAHGAGIIHRLALVGTEGPNHTRKLPSVIDTQLRKLSLLAARDANINKEVPDMAALFERVMRKLRAEPMPVTVTDRESKKKVTVNISAYALSWMMLVDIGDGHDFTVFPALLKTIDDGDPSILAWFVEKRYNQLTGGVSLMHVGMECSSGVTANRQRQIEQEAATSSFGDAVRFIYPEVCKALPDVDLGEAFRGPIASDVPTLFISGSLDSNAPPFQAEELRWGMPRATHLVVENAGHEDTLPMPEVQSAIRDFLDGTDVAGRRLALPAPRFLDVAAAKADRRVR